MPQDSSQSELLQSLIKGLDESKSAEDLKKLMSSAFETGGKDRLDALKQEVEKAIASEGDTRSNRIETYLKLRGLMISTFRDMLIESLAKTTVETLNTSDTRQPKAKEISKPAPKTDKPHESLDVFEDKKSDRKPTGPDTAPQSFTEYLRSNNGTPSYTAEGFWGGLWNKIKPWFDLQAPDAEQKFNENIWSRPKYWLGYGIYRLMHLFDSWGKNKPAVTLSPKPEDKPTAPDQAQAKLETKQQVPEAKPNPTPTNASSQPNTAPKPTVEQIPEINIPNKNISFHELQTGVDLGKYKVKIDMPRTILITDWKNNTKKWIIEHKNGWNVTLTDASWRNGSLHLSGEASNPVVWVIGELLGKSSAEATLGIEQAKKILDRLATGTNQIQLKDAQGKNLDAVIKPAG